MNKLNSWNKESGGSLVAVMVAMALFAVVAVMASQSFRNISVSGRRVEAAMSAREVESVIIQAMVSRFQNYVIAGCPNTPNSSFNGPIGNLLTTNHKNVAFYDRNQQRISPPAAAAKDLERCLNTPFAKITPSSADTFYGCFDLKTENEAYVKAIAGASDAFAANRGAFLEMFVKLKNFKTDTMTVCNAMAQDRGFGLEIYYSLHWTTPAGDTVMYDSKLGTLNAAL